jgi:hypothetical protein
MEQQKRKNASTVRIITLALQFFSAESAGIYKKNPDRSPDFLKEVEFEK